MNSYEERVLIKLRRNYSRDETVSALSTRLKKAETENGQLKSEVEHLEFQLDQLKKVELSKKDIFIIKKQKIVRRQQTEINALKKEIKKLKTFRDLLISRSYNNTKI